MTQVSSPITNWTGETCAGRSPETGSGAKEPDERHTGGPAHPSADTAPPRRHDTATASRDQRRGPRVPQEPRESPAGAAAAGRLEQARPPTRIASDPDFEHGWWPGPHRGRSAPAGEYWAGPSRFVPILETANHINRELQGVRRLIRLAPIVSLRLSAGFLVWRARRLLGESTGCETHLVGLRLVAPVD